MRDLLNDFRLWLGSNFLLWAIKMLPARATVREGLLRGLREQRAYDRYDGYTRLMGEEPRAFESWREIQGTFYIKKPKRKEYEVRGVAA